MTVSITRRRRTTPKQASRLRRQIRVRKHIFGSPQRPRLVVTRSSKHVFAQVVDDTQGHTLVSASTMEGELRGMQADKTAKAGRVGELIAQRAVDAGLSSVVFDRAGNQYAGRIAALADKAREGGLVL